MNRWQFLKAVHSRKVSDLNALSAVLGSLAVGRVTEFWALGVMTRITSITLFFTVLILALGGCAHCSNTGTSNQQSFEQMQAETERAFELERRADVVIDYQGSGDIRLWIPGQTACIRATDQTLAPAIASATSKRELAVVIIGKPVRYAFPEPQLRVKADAIEAIVKAQGFTRVVFQLASATGRPIYRE